MDIGYLEDRKSLRFVAKEDIVAGKPLSQFIDILSTPIVCIFQKSNKTRILICSKECLIGLIILGNSGFIDFGSNVDSQSFLVFKNDAIIVNYSDEPSIKEELESLESYCRAELIKNVG